MSQKGISPILIWILFVWQHLLEFSKEEGTAALNFNLKWQIQILQRLFNRKKLHNGIEEAVRETDDIIDFQIIEGKTY